jgi:hypothetical protein
MFAQNSGENYFFSGICDTMPATRGLGFKNINFGLFPVGQEVPKTVF